MDPNDQKEKDIFFARLVVSGHVPGVKKALLEGHNANAVDQKGDSVLMLAARRDDVEVVDALIEHGANIHHRSHKGSSPLIAASMRGATRIVKKLIELGANVNDETDSKDTALSLAVWQNQTEAALLLIEAGANVLRQDNFGDTMLLDAATNGNTMLMKGLLEKKIEIDHANKKGETALIRAAWKNQVSAVELLLEAGANPNIQNQIGHTALILAAIHGNNECVKLLVNHPTTNMNLKDSSGTALFHMWQKCGGLEDCTLPWDTVVHMIMTGADLSNYLDDELLAMACYAGNLDAVSALVCRRGTSVDYQHPGYSRQTPLQHNINSPHQDIAVIDLLLSMSASLSCQDEKGNTALMDAILACGRNRSNPKLFEQGKAIITLLVEKGASKHVENQFGKSALQLALTTFKINSDRDVLDLFIGKDGSEVNEAVLLLNAASHGILNDVRALLESDHPENKDGKVLDINAADEQFTALMAAAVANQTEIVTYLLQMGADATLKDKNGATALVLAIRANQTQVAEVLATHGMQPSVGVGNVAGETNAEYQSTTRFMLRLGMQLNESLDLAKENAALKKQLSDLGVAAQG